MDGDGTLGYEGNRRGIKMWWRDGMGQDRMECNG